MTALNPERFPAQYRELHAELLARPFPVVSGQVMVAYRPLAFTPAEAAALGPRWRPWPHFTA